MQYTEYSAVNILLQINTLVCYTLVLVLVLGIGTCIAEGQYYWISGALFGIILTLVNTNVSQYQQPQPNASCDVYVT